MEREKQIARLEKTKQWDIIIIGGGASGLGIALDAALRGYKTLLCEARDFAQGTSSRSTKLLHGGVRYLAQGDFALVYEALHERDKLTKNAPHLCREQTFIIPNPNLFHAAFYGIGLKIYDLMAGKLGMGKTSLLGRDEARRRLKGIREDKIISGVCYYDGQFDDARLALALAQSAEKEGACVLNYAKVEELLKDNEGKIKGVRLRLKSETALESALDSEKISESEITCEAYASCVINATGVFTNDINALDKDTSNNIAPSQGIHLVFDREFLPSCGELGDALMIPKTPDGRVLFAIPWHVGGQGKLVVGTTDTPIQTPSYEPQALEEEIDFVLDTFSQYAAKTPTRADVKSVFVGLRPLAATASTQATKNISRSHKVSISPSLLVSIGGGKWTTYRQMAQDCLDFAISHKLLPQKPCSTHDYRIYGYSQELNHTHRLHMYGCFAKDIAALEESPELGKKLHEDYAYTYAQVQYAISHEMARSLEDVLARRLRLLFLDSKAAEACAPQVAAFMAEYLKWSEEVKNAQLQSFLALAKSYQL